jgi:Clp amino terminal domain, pathogenicity island component
MTPPPALQDLIDTVRQDSPTDGPLDQLATAAATAAQLESTSDALLSHFVDRCRRDGRSWTEISTALGVTKQAVHKRFAGDLADRIIAANPEPSLERFTARARAVLAAARRAAQQSGVPGNSGHLLLALYTEPEGIASRVLVAMGISAEAVQAAFEALPAAADPQASRTGFTADAARALRDALAVALHFGHNYIGTEHLLLGLYQGEDSPAAAILAAVGSTKAEAITRVVELLRGRQAG